jgi:hypothetical protein
MLWMLPAAMFQDLAPVALIVLLGIMPVFVSITTLFEVVL